MSERQLLVDYVAARDAIADALDLSPYADINDHTSAFWKADANVVCWGYDETEDINFEDGPYMEDIRLTKCGMELTAFLCDVGFEKLTWDSKNCG